MHTAGNSTTNQPRLRGVEPSILERLGNTPWELSMLTDTQLAEAKRVWRELRAAVGFKPLATGWVTTENTSPKLAKSGVPSIGVTLLSAQSAATIWAGAPLETHQALARAVGATTDEVADALGVTVCPFATEGCIDGCVTGKSANAQLRRSQLSRLARHVLTVMRPDLAICLLAEQLQKLKDKHGDRARWRVNVSDDIRWELLAPGLFDIGVRGYAYTKFSPTMRPGRPGLSVVYSAHERTSLEKITSYIAQGHRVAVVLDIPKNTMVKTWHGLPVSNGDVTDDLWVHPAGHIVGLSAKAPTKEMKEQMRQCGFSKPPTEAPVKLIKKQKKTEANTAATGAPLPAAA